jgi:uracil-DNA glycosylase
LIPSLGLALLSKDNISFSLSMSVSETIRRQYLHHLGVPIWVQRKGDRSDKQSEGDHSDAALPASSVDAMQALSDTVSVCKKCHLHERRTQTVFGVGNPQAAWLFVGEAPGAEEDRKGEPFVGRAGQLLNAMLLALGLTREQVYIANVLKCRPPGNRDPQPQEVACCEPYLIQQIEFIRPRLIVTLGRHAAHSLLKTDLPLNRLRGRSLSYHDIPLIVTYHPAYLLRNLIDKRKAWDDLCLARSIVNAS